VAQLEEGEVVLLPGSHQLVPGRRIVGATLRTKSLKAAENALRQGGLDVPETVSTKGGTSIFLTPDLTHGIWLELREPRLLGGPALTDGQEGRTR
jgi:hypothetical protein